jgi:DNA primase large subunit
MNRLDARYPFFASAREAVQQAGVSLPDLVAEGAPAVERGRERVERALLEGTVEPEDPGRWSPRDELLSYPVARVLVSLVDAPAAVEKYAGAEAATAYERFTEDFAAGDDGLQSTERVAVTLEDVLREFDLSGVVSEERGDASRQGRKRADGAAVGATTSGRPARWFRVDVAAFLRLSGDWGPHWRLVNRELASGEVRTEREELYRMLREAVRRRVSEGLPFEVTNGARGEEIAEALEPAVADLRDLLGDRDDVGEIDAVVPELFPPCIDRLLERARDGEEFTAPERFSLLSFLVGIGMDATEVLAFCGTATLDAGGVQRTVEYLDDDRGSQYPTPSCETLETYGVCENGDDHREVASHPMVYYARMLEHAGGDAPPDWRKRDRETAVGGEDGSDLEAER